MTERHCSELQELVCSYTQWGTWLRSYCADLDTLVNDHVLLTGDQGGDPWTIRFAVDFREIYMFLFPFSDFLQYGASISDRSKALRNTALDYLARASLFRHTWGIGELFLLPPYRQELNHRLLTQLPRGMQDSNLADIEGRLADALASTAERVSGASADNDEAVTILGKHYLEFSLLLVASAPSLLSRVDEVLERKVTAPPADSMLGKVVPDPRAVDVWQQHLTMRRKGRSQQSQRDATAIAMVREANRLSRRAGKKELFALVTSSEAIHDVKRRLERSERLDLREVVSDVHLRSLSNLLVYLKNVTGFAVDAAGSPVDRMEANKTILENLGRARSRASEYLSLTEIAAQKLRGCPCDAEGSPDVDCPLRQIELMIESSLAELRATREEIENTQLILKNHPDLNSEYSRLVQEEDATQFDRQLISILDMLIKQNGVEASAAKRIESLVEQLVIELVEFNAQVVSYSSNLTDRMLYLLEEFPFHVHVSDPEFQAALTDTSATIAAAAKDGEPEAAAAALRNLISALLRDGLGDAESIKIELLITLALGNTELVLKLVDQCLEMSIFVHDADLEYLKARTLFAAGRRDAHSFALEALDRHEDDARFYLLGGTLDWRELTGASASRVSDLSGPIETSIAGLEVCQKLEDDSLLMCDLLNNLAYFYIHSEPQAIEKAGDAVTRLIGLKEMDSWRCSWLHTYGYILLSEAQASVGSCPISEIRKLALRSLSLFQKASEGFISKSSQRIVLAHQGEALEVLESLGPG